MYESPTYVPHMPVFFSRAMMGVHVATSHMDYMIIFVMANLNVSLHH